MNWKCFGVYEVRKSFVLSKLNHYVGIRLRLRLRICYVYLVGYMKFWIKIFDWIIGYMIMRYFSVDLYFINGLFQKEIVRIGICENSQRIVVGYQLPP